MIEYNASNHDYSVTTGTSGAMSLASRGGLQERRKTRNLPVGALHGHSAQLPTLLSDSP
jgi:hypothetical protein